MPGLASSNEQITGLSGRGADICCSIPQVAGFLVLGTQHRQNFSRTWKSVEGIFRGEGEKGMKLRKWSTCKWVTLLKATISMMIMRPWMQVGKFIFMLSLIKGNKGQGTFHCS